MANLALISEVDPSPQGTPVTEELRRLTTMVADACPPGAIISFSFQGYLRIAVDVRMVEEVHAVETALPAIAGGIFRDIGRTRTPNHAFMRRVTAMVDR